MSANVDNLNSPTELPTELAHRTGNGLDVRLLWNRGDGRLKVVVDDLHTADSFELWAGDGKQALDAFYHPFAYAAARGVAYRTEAEVESDEPEVAASTSSLR